MGIIDLLKAPDSMSCLILRRKSASASLFSSERALMLSSSRDKAVLGQGRLHASAVFVLAVTVIVIIRHPTLVVILICDARVAYIKKGLRTDDLDLAFKVRNIVIQLMNDDVLALLSSSFPSIFTEPL